MCDSSKCLRVLFFHYLKFLLFSTKISEVKNHPNEIDEKMSNTCDRKSVFQKSHRTGRVSKVLTPNA